MKYQVSTIPGGIRVATAEMPHMRSVSAGLWVAVGGRYETAECSGISHFIEHMLFKGTARRTARQITADVEGVGGYINAFTTEDSTCFYAQAGAKNLPRLLDVLCDMLLHSIMDPNEIEREREVIREEILMYRDQPSQYAQELLGGALWGRHPLGRPLTGTSESVGKLQRDDFFKYLHQHYNKATVIATVAGNTTHAEVVSILTPALNALGDGCSSRYQRCHVRKLRPGMAAADHDVEQAQFVLGFPAMGRRDPRRYALKVLSVLLGENMSSRLFQMLRERHGLCYSVHTCTMGLDEVGAFQFAAGLAPSCLKKAAKLTLREFDRIASRPVSKRELNQAKDYTIGQIQLGLESTSNQLMWMGESMLGYGRVLDPEDVEQAFGAVTAEAVGAVAREVLQPARMAGALVCPGASEEMLRSILSSAQS